MSTNFLSFIRSKIGSHLTLESSLQMEQSNRTFLKAKKREQITRTITPYTLKKGEVMNTRVLET